MEEQIEEAKKELVEVVSLEDRVKELKDLLDEKDVVVNELKERIKTWR